MRAPARIMIGVVIGAGFLVPVVLVGHEIPGFLGGLGWFVRVVITAAVLVGLGWFAGYACGKKSGEAVQASRIRRGIQRAG